jgi:hypothetical protein
MTSVRGELDEWQVSGDDESSPSDDNEVGSGTTAFADHGLNPDGLLSAQTCRADSRPMSDIQFHFAASWKRTLANDAA